MFISFRKMLSTVTHSALLDFAAASPLLPRDIGQSGLFDSITPSTSLVWEPCHAVFFCAVLDVPLDYTSPSDVRAFIPLIKYPASTGPYQGMIFTNPGGPGTSAVDDFLTAAPIYAPIVGTNYDLVAYEPRGIGYSIPAAICSTTVPAQLLKRILKPPSGPRLPSKFYEDEYTYQQGLGTACLAAIRGINEAGQHMSTAIVARDAISILDAYVTSNYSAGVTNPEDFNFWGFSYGTIIGQTFAMLYPNRVGRFVLDGVNDAEDYYAGLGLRNIYLADRAFSTFFTYCSKAGSSKCSFHTGSTSKDIFDRFERIALRLDAKKAYQENWGNRTAIFLGLQALKIIASRATYFPNSTFPNLANALVYFEGITQAGITVQNIEAFEMWLGLKLNLHPFPASTQWAPAVGCPDTGNKNLGKTLQQMQPVTKQLEKQSWVFGELFAGQRIACAWWSIPGKGRYNGKFGGSTKTPILFVSNTRDPVTPLPNGIKAALIFSKAKLLTIDGTGHTTNGPINKCAYAKIKTYFQTGAASTSFCPLEEGPFEVTLSGLMLKRAEEQIETRITALVDKLGW